MVLFPIAVALNVSKISLNSVLNTLRGIMMIFIVNSRNIVKRLNAKGDDEIRICKRFGINA
jgi:hypothetical protein